MIVLFKGDDTGGAFGKSVTLTISTDKDIFGAKLYFELCGIRREFENVSNGDSVVLHFSHNDTARMPVGTHKATIWIVDASGKIRTLDNAVPVRVTTSLVEAYKGDDSTKLEIKRAVAWARLTDVPNFVLTINSTAPDADGNFKLNPIAVKGIDLTGIEDWTESTTNKERRMSFNRLLAALRSAIACVVAVCGFAVFGADSITTSTDGELNEDSQVVTSVTIDHSSAIDARVTRAYIEALAHTTTSNTIERALALKEDAEIIPYTGTKTLTGGNANVSATLVFTYENGWMTKWSATIRNNFSATGAANFTASGTGYSDFSKGATDTSIVAPTSRTDSRLYLNFVTDPDSYTLYNNYGAYRGPFGYVRLGCTLDRYVLFYKDDMTQPLYLYSVKPFADRVNDVVTAGGYVTAGAAGTIATNSTKSVVTKEYVEALGISGGGGAVESVNSETGKVVITAAKIGAYPQASGTTLEGDVAEIKNTTDTWEAYWGGTNVIFEVTNYYGNTSGVLPTLRIKELREGEWKEVWADDEKYASHFTNFEAVVSNEMSAIYAPKAWGKYTDVGDVNEAASNSVWITSPNTYFAGGTEYKRVSVGTGSICVLVSHGASAYTAGEDGTFRFQDDAGDSYFGFSKTDSYTIGCNAESISVSGGVVSITYEVIIGGGSFPIVYYKPTLSTATWEQLNDETGASLGGTYSVTWELSATGQYTAHLNVGTNPQGFFRAETSVAGQSTFSTNMKADLSGGILCTDGKTIIKPVNNGGTITWEIQ